VNKGRRIIRIIRETIIFTLWILLLVFVFFILAFSLSTGLSPIEGCRRLLLIASGYFQVLFLPKVTIEGSFPLEIAETQEKTLEKDILFRSSIFSFSVIIEDIQITNVGGLNGTVTCINQFPIEVPAFGDFKMRVIVTLGPEAKPGRYWISYKITFRRK
jgi:hypothetical protein